MRLALTATAFTTESQTDVSDWRLSSMQSIAPAVSAQHREGPGHSKQSPDDDPTTVPGQGTLVSHNKRPL